MEQLLLMPSDQSLQAMSDSELTFNLQCALNQLLECVRCHESTTEIRLIYEAYKRERKERLEFAAQSYIQGCKKHLTMVHQYSEYTEVFETPSSDKIIRTEYITPLILPHLNRLLDYYEMLAMHLINCKLAR